MTKRLFINIPIILILVALVMPLTLAAQLQGNIYNNYLKPSKAIVEINTKPIQKLVVNNNYKFNVPLGTYTIKAYYNNLKTEENITITKEGIYNLDLIMFPTFEEEESLYNFDIDIEYEKKSYWYIYLIVIGIILIIVSCFIPKKKITKEEDPLTKELLDFIKEKDGRVTQKEIRKKFPLSEAKISLILTELEHNKKIKKIKKGRSNIIILRI